MGGGQRGGLAGRLIIRSLPLGVQRSGELCVAGWSGPAHVGRCRGRFPCRVGWTR